MRQDAWRAYAEIALGMTEASRKRASKVVKELLGKGGATAEQVQALADDLFKASASNREALASVVRAEIDRTLTRVGLVKAEEVATLESRVRDLEAQLAARDTTANAVEAAQEAADAARAEVGKASAVGTPVKTVAKKTVAKKAVAKKTTTALEPVGTVEAAAAEIAKPAPARKTAAKKTVAKKTVAKKAPAKRAGDDA